MVTKKGELPFSVDSAILEELGEKLVGRSYIALAELIKNSYDADASEVTITINRGNDEIIVNDNGHGMTFEEFDSHWMRIGSRHKERAKFSRVLSRILTGSKGIGRLAAQFLATKLEVITCSETDDTTRLRASVDWSKARIAGDITEAVFRYEIEEDGPYEHGTQLYLSDLTSNWESDDIEKLANEIWWLQPPFRHFVSVDKGTNSDFKIELISHEDLEKSFQNQMNTILDIWYARIVGENKNGHVQLSVQWEDGKLLKYTYIIPNCKLDYTNFEIRIYHLRKRQPKNIRVGIARNYISRFGGVHIYDSGFRLPYYGDPKNDWLGTEHDHAHRLAKSPLLPAELQKGVHRGMQFLPTMSRLFGVVNVSTSEEDDLNVLVTRDRFRETKALIDLKNMVRFSIDYYALMEQKRQIRIRERERTTLGRKTRTVQEVLDAYEQSVPSDVFKPMKNEISESIAFHQTEAELIADQAGMLGSLATAGITTLAYQHESKSLFKSIEKDTKEIQEIESSISDVKVRGRLRYIRERLDNWVIRARRTNALFSHLSDPEDLEDRKRFLAYRIVEKVWNQISFLMKGVDLNTSNLDRNLYLPAGSLAEWSSVFQNVFLNAYNAMLLSKKKEISISNIQSTKQIEILIQDTGYGIDLDEIERLFLPFERDLKLPPSVKEAGYGGSGMGLTIIRLIANSINCRVNFITPKSGYSTAFSLSWRDT